MIISNITPPQVWSASARSLTNIGSGALAPTSTVQTALAGASSVSFRTANGVVAQITVVGLTGAGATSAIAIQIFDGTNTTDFVSSAAAAASPVGFSGICTAGVGLSIVNHDATHAGTYMVAAFSWTI